MAGKANLKNQRVFKGSGDIYAVKYDGTLEFPELETDPTTKKVTVSAENETAIFTALKTIRTEDNRLGALKDGFKYSDQLEVLEDQDDLGYITVQEVTKETAANEFKLFNANGETIQKVHPTASTGEGTQGLKVTKMGGLTNKNDDEYYVMFVHQDTQNGDIVLLTRGKNLSGLDINFAGSEVSPLQCKYNAQPLDDTGTLIYIFELPKKFDWATGTVKA